MTGASARGTLKNPKLWVSMALVFFNVGAALLVTWAVAGFGSIAAARAYLRGERLLVECCPESFGRVREGETPSVCFRLRNASCQPVRILGAKNSCACAVADALPATVEAGTTRTVKVRVETNRSSGPLDQSIRLYTDFPGQPEVVLRVVGWVEGRRSDATPPASKHQGH